MTAKKKGPYVGACHYCEREFQSPMRKRFCSDPCRLQAWKLSRKVIPPAPDVDSWLVADEARIVHEHPQYAVTTDGRVFSRVRGFWKQLRAGKCGSRKQYLHVSLGSGNRWDIHRLVAHVFIGPCPDGQEVRHLDGNSSNNHFSNLAYGTRKQNMSDAILHGTTCRGTRNEMAKLDIVSVRAIRNLYEQEVLNGAAIARVFEISHETVSQIIHKRRWGWLDEQERAQAN